MNTQFAVAPSAPGSLGGDLESTEILRYLSDLTRWRERRQVELDQLDEACLRSPERDSLTGDILLSMALWKAVAERHDLIVETWDSGRVLEPERRRIATLIWGRLDQRAADGNALAVSLPEACRLSDTLAGSLRSRLNLEGAEPDVSHRVRSLRSQIERIRDQVDQVPARNRSSAQEALVRLDRRLVDVTDRAKRGADVGGLLGPLEIEAATAERDLIVAASTRARAKNDRLRAEELQADLQARGAAVRSLAARTVAQISPAPKLAVPDVTALGDVPEDSATVAAYLARLDRVGRALDQAHSAYAAALAEREELGGRMHAYAAKAETLPPEAADDLDALMQRAHAELAATPSSLTRLRALAAAQQAYLQGYERSGS